MVARLRQLAHDLENRLLLVPGLFVLGAVILAPVMAGIDGAIDDEALPRMLVTTVEGGRAILSAIAGGLITSTTLLLSLVLVAVQLAASQFSPRTLQDWTGDRTQQVAIGLVLGTSVYSLLVLRGTRQVGEADSATAFVPHLSVMLAVVLGVLSLVAVLRAVDDLTTRLRVGSVIDRITDRTVAMIEQTDDEREGTWEGIEPAGPGAIRSESADRVPATSTRSGWVQQLDEQALLRAIPSGAAAELTVGVGSFVLHDAPLLWLDTDPGEDRVAAIRDAIVIGDERTLQQDVGFGVLQLVDVAVRALSPGVNDPNTAIDVVSHLGVVLLALWERPVPPPIRTADGSTLLLCPTGHEQFLDQAVGPIRRYGHGDASVVVALIRTLDQLRSEARRRALPGPIAPIDDAIDAVVDDFRRADPSPADLRQVEVVRSATCRFSEDERNRSAI